MIAVRAGGRLERVEVAKVESLVPERRAEIESGEMIRHFLLPLKIDDVPGESACLQL